MAMTSRERVLAQIEGREPDRVPLMGGWFHGVDNLASLAGMSVERYLAAPAESLVLANRALGVDCMIRAIVPTRRDQIRTSQVLDGSFPDQEPEVLKREAERVPESAAELRRALDLGAVERAYRDYFAEWTRLLGDIVLVPTFWEAVPKFELFGVYGYSAHMAAIGLYPEHVGRLHWKAAVEARARNEVLVSAMRDFAIPPLLFTGSDICNNAGPMCSVAFLRRHYFPHVKIALEPLFDAGISVVRHCDGDVMPLVDDFIDVGYAGFQGFQYECGVDPFDIAERMRARGRRPLFFAGLNVTRTLPFGSVDDVRSEIDYVLDFTRGGEGLFFFTSSSIGPEVPLGNVTFAYDYVASGRAASAPRSGRPRAWPGCAGGSRRPARRG
jgi:hypothetical protein